MTQAETGNPLQNPCEGALLLQNLTREGFSILYDKYSAALFGIITKMAGNKLMAEELLQDVFVKIWKHSSKYDASKARLFTWMAAIARNTCIDYLRSRQYKNERQTLTDFPANTEAVSSPEFITDTDRKAIFSLSRKLDRKYTDVIELVYFMGYSQQEAAECLNMPAGTVKTRSRHALQQLRLMLNEQKN